MGFCRMWLLGFKKPIRICYSLNMSKYVYMTIYVCILLCYIPGIWPFCWMLNSQKMGQDMSRRPKQGIVGFPLCKHIHSWLFNIAPIQIAFIVPQKTPLKTVQWLIVLRIYSAFVFSQGDQILRTNWLWTSRRSSSLSSGHPALLVDDMNPSASPGTGIAGGLFVLLFDFVFFINANQ